MSKRKAEMFKKKKDVIKLLSHLFFCFLERLC